MLLISLTQNNTEIQKLVTFQATFEKLLSIIEAEEGISGDIVVQDSLTLMHNLLRYNVSNQVKTKMLHPVPEKSQLKMAHRSIFARLAASTKFQGC